MFAAGFIIIFYFWTFFTRATNIGLLVSSAAVIVSAIAFILAVVAYLWPPKKYIKETSLAVYGLLAAMAATLVLTSGGAFSPFIALWILVAIFAGIFGLWGLVPIFIAGSYYLAVSLMTGGTTQSVVITTIVAGWLPVVVSYVIWHTKGTGEKNNDRAFHELASELSEVASKAEVVINAIADGVIAVDREGVIQLINPAAQQITGWGKQDATSLSYKSVLKLVDKNDQELTSANDPVQEVLATNKEVQTSDLSLTTHSGKKLLVSVIVSPVGQLGTGAIIVFRDITAEKREEREMAEFISTASHEMRTPVASIEGYLGLALNPATAQVDEKARDFITKAHESAQHLGRLFQDLLDVSKADDGRLSNNPKVVDVVHFVHDIVEGLRPQADAKQLRLHFKPMPDDEESERHLSPVFYTHVDNDHLREVVANLTENAIKYTPSGDVIIDVTGDTDHVVISVADSGIGIPAEDIPHLFQKFYRVDNSATREIGGTGLGLYLCRRLAEVMGGRIWVESKFKQGSTFFLEVPRIDHQEATRLIEQATQEENKETPLIQHVETITNQFAEPEVSPSPPEPPVILTPQPDLVPLTPAVPIPEPQPAPVPPVPAPQPVAIPGVHDNIPLSSIEQNPQQYVQPRQQTINIPPRDNK
jgi:PAS domain S-box-containing protein